MLKNFKLLIQAIFISNWQIISYFEKGTFVNILSLQIDFKVVRSIDDAERNSKAVDNWIESISDLHRQKPPQNVHYSKTMPDIESLMQEWPPEFEEMLKTVRNYVFH